MARRQFKFPSDFADFLTPRGRRILAGRDPATGSLLEDKFVFLRDVINPRRAYEGVVALEGHLQDHLVPMDEPIPPETITKMQFNYEEWLPKSVRVRTAYMDSKREAGWTAAREIGLAAMMRSPSFHRFAELLAGRKLRKTWGTQVLCYGAGDYTGPHNDHHPEDEEARDGYVDIHISLPTPTVSSHFLVYEEQGHLSKMVDVNALGGVSAYRLPFWHYTTPLQAKPGFEPNARRWLLLGTFLYDRRRVS